MTKIMTWVRMHPVTVGYIGSTAALVAVLRAVSG